MRKAPLQNRGKQAVAQIVNGGFVAVQKYGREGVTTAKIAALAGVSPSAIYQYFADKDEVFEAMDQRFVDDLMRFLDDSMPRIRQLSVREAIASLFTDFSALLRSDDGLYLTYLRQSIGPGQAKFLPAIEKRLLQMAMEYVLHHPELARVKNLPVVAFVIINSGVFAVISHLSTRKPMFSFDDLVSGICTMADAYVAAETNPASR